MTLYEGLENFRDLYNTRLSDSSRRISDPIATDWQRISNEYDLYYEAIALGDYTSADVHIQNIIDILGGYDIIVDEPSQGPLPININVYPSTIFVSCDSSGTPINYTGSYADVIIREGGTDETTNWTIAVQSVTNISANISGGNRVNITSLTSTSGEVTLRCTRTGYNDQDITVTVLKSLQGATGGSSSGGVIRQTGLSTENIEQDSSLGYGKNSTVIGIGNVNGTSTLASYSVNSVVASTNTINIVSSVGDQTSYYVTGYKIYIFYQLLSDYASNGNISTDPYYYIVGTIVSSSYTTYTEVIISPDFAFSTTIETFLNNLTYTGLVFAVAVDSTIETYKSNIFGSINVNSGISNNLYGVGNNSAKNYVNQFGHYSSSTTNGEISFSSSSSPVRKAIYLLEGFTASTSIYQLKTLLRGSAGESTYAEDVHLDIYTGFSFTLEVIGIYYPGAVGQRKRYTGMVTRNATILSYVTGSSLTEITDYSIGTDVITVTLNSTTYNIEVYVTPGSTNSCNWIGWIEGVFTDFPQS